MRNHYHVAADSSLFSKSLANVLNSLNHPKVLSTIHLLGKIYHFGLIPSEFSMVFSSFFTYFSVGGIKLYKAMSDIYRNRRNQDNSFMMVAAWL
jgi:hypothetical protein